jgi:outer membrane receptor for ferric coprogen and ferric-rhodotorulic acid
MNVIIPEIYERMWTEKLKFAHNSVVLADAKDYKLIELLNRYEIYYIYEHNDNNVFDQIYYKTIEDRISEYRGINNEEPYRTEEPFFRY